MPGFFMSFSLPLLLISLVLTYKDIACIIFDLLLSIHLHLALLAGDANILVMNLSPRLVLLSGLVQQLFRDSVL